MPEEGRNIENIKILHIHNVAGIAGTLTKFIDGNYGTESLVLMRSALDKYNFMRGGSKSNCGAISFILKCILTARKFNIIHIHDLDKIVPWLKRLYNNKPVVLHYHGTRIRGLWREREELWKKSDAILVSTPDLLEGAPKSAIYVPNPVDIRFFTQNRP